MAYWLVKSEPATWSWDDQMSVESEHWDGVRNYQASNNLKAMRIGDQAFFYHSQKGKEIVGIVEVVKEYYPDPSDSSGRFGMVDFKAVRPLKTPVTLAAIKEHPELKEMPLVRQSRLSVMPVSDEHWALVCELGGTTA
ncbi:EVE domain-containing protein [Fodinicurvata sp. EGI_FJ10296]|jgi:predicted RNA-binding protein with PUA-like domain|uniref:EVE domain-containing protein n=1 Tax=Fodinicurvata sp. EGI_FJ10296 TaxID=3231908 RepID=UPI0034513F18